MMTARLLRGVLTTLSMSLFASICFAQMGAEAPRPAATSLTRPYGATGLVDDRGFVHRWLVLEPIPVSGRLTESAIEEALRLATLPDAAERHPMDGDVVDMNGVAYTWHALETIRYNLNLYHFAWSLSKPTSNVLFWVETTVDSPREIGGLRLAIGSNAASRWWLNGELVIALNDDRQTVIDDGVSRRITLRKGQNVIRAAIINGGGATDFCARFLDENGQPLTGLRVMTPLKSGIRP